MQAIIITIADIKAIKNLIDLNEQLKENSYQVDGYSYNYGGKEALIEAKEEQINKNISTTASLLGVTFNEVVDMCYDFDFAKMVLNDIYNN